jgi:hypothetical protein
MAKNSGNQKSKGRGESRTPTRRRSASRSEETLGRVTKVTTNHDKILRWGQERGAKPARVRGTGDVGVIRLEFPGAPGARDEQLDPISWEEWLKKFDENGLAFVFEENTASGRKSNFNKLVKKETAKAKAARASSAREPRCGRLHLPQNHPLIGQLGLVSPATTKNSALVKTAQVFNRNNMVFHRIVRGFPDA